MFTPASAWQPPSELPDLRGRGLVIAEDTEGRDEGLAQKRGSGWVYGAGHISGVSWAWEDQAVYVPFRHPDSPNFDEDAVRRWVADHHADPTLTWVYQNAPHDLGWQRTQWGLRPPERIHDTTAMAYMVDENRISYNLDALARWRGLPGKDETLLKDAASAYGYPDVKKAIWRLPARYVGPYAEGDGRTTLGLFHSLMPVLEAEGTLEAYQLECDLIPLILEMRLRGIRVDLGALERAQVQLISLRDDALRQLSDQLGHRVGMDDIRSARRLEVYFDAQKIAYPKTPKTGTGSFDKSWMRGNSHWLPRLVDLARQMDDAGGKFLTDYILNFTHRGRLHANINQFKSEEGGTRSHRFSYSAPPLQQMPKRNDLTAALIRGVFLPEPGEMWCSVDFSQQEYRLIVHFSELLGLERASAAGDRYRLDPETDYHAMVAELTGLDRKPAKDANFAKAYGAGVSKFALMTNLTVERAAAIMEQYDREVPFVSRLAARCEELAGQRGWVRLLDGARCHFDEWEPAWRDWQGEADYRAAGGKGGLAPTSREEAMARVAEEGHPWHGRLRRAMTRVAGNRLIQGSAARQTKLAMRACWREGIVPLVQMHDELARSTPDEAGGRRMAELMRDVVKLTVPMSADPEYGVTWGRARKEKDKQGRVVYGATWAEAQVEAA